ncbi:Ubiquinone biosynthesis hydroxylase, UbiH/UbiF/VisC/COQ6 [mine drainage metagenome]|uniref:Ubiquinone biosynthesis hydroxylase, UbiH/UbiF/VisC/COQ6 n=1 Tax=mine drainage metagenome TaxID=410659 RepID=T1AM08_9ZZZZ
MSRRLDADIIVIGAGMVGAAAALALARQGYTVQLLDAAPPPAPPGPDLDLRVVALAPSSARLLATLGVWPLAERERVASYRAMHVWDAASGAAFDFDAGLLDAQCLGWIVENRLLQWVLWQALLQAGVVLRSATQAVGHAVDADGARVDLADGDSLRARLLLAADGRDSPLRQTAGIGVRGRDYGQRAVVAHLRSARPHAHTAWQRFLPGGPLALLPLADGRVSLVWSLPEAEAARMLALDEEDFAQAVGVASDFRLGPLQLRSTRAAFTLRLALAERFDAPRLALLGDAAHAVHPLAGQGVNLGLRDVRELCDLLGAARRAGRDPGAATLLVRYARRRRSSDARDAYSFDALARLFALQAAPVVAARGLGMRALQVMPALKRKLAQHAMGWPA